MLSNSLIERASLLAEQNSKASKALLQASKDISKLGVEKTKALESVKVMQQRLENSQSRVLNTLESVEAVSVSTKSKMSEENANSEESSNSKSFKIYVYELPPKFNRGIKNNKCSPQSKVSWQTKYSNEVYIHRALLRSPNRTLNPDHATLFYVPVYPCCFLHSHRVDFSLTSNLISDSIHYIKENFPYWNRKLGADHIFSMTHDLGGCIAPYKEIKHAILLTNSGEMHDREDAYRKYSNMYSPRFAKENDFKRQCYTPTKDIVIPPMIRSQKMLKVTDAEKSKVRKQLAMFRGYINSSSIYSRGIRQLWYKLYKDDPDVSIEHKSPKFERLRGYKTDYLNDMLLSKFCLCPPGWASWTPRVFESILLGCIPVVVSDYNVLPFESFINYKDFSVFIPEKNANRLKEILLAIPEEQIKKMQKKMKEISPMFKYSYIGTSSRINGTELPGAFSYIMKELQEKAKQVGKRLYL
eukprot:g5539.t1